MTKGNHTVWCEMMDAGLQQGGFLEVCKFGPTSENGLKAIHMQLVADNKLADNDGKAAKQVEAKAMISHQNAHAFMVTALGGENAGLHLDPGTKSAVQLFAAIHALFGVTDTVNKRAAEADFWKKAGKHVYEENKDTAGLHIGDCHRLWQVAQATGSRVRERQAIDGVASGLSIMLWKEKDKWLAELDGMPADANVLPEGSWERLKLAFEREETRVHHKRAALKAESTRGGGTALATKEGPTEIEQLKKQINAQAKELKALATVSKSGAGGLVCYKFKDTGSCDFGDRCRYSHGGGGRDGGRGGGYNKQKAGGACRQFRKKGSCKFGDSCRYSHADGSADGEQDSD